MAGRPMGKQAWARRQEEIAAYRDELSRWFAIDEKTGERVNPGDKVVTFRGEELVFDRISDYPVFGKSGKVLVKDPTVEEGKPFHTREFYPSVINVKLDRECKGN
jgi:hypothetical protein